MKSVRECPIKILSSSAPVGTLCGILVLIVVVIVLTLLKPLKGVPVCERRKVTKHPSLILAFVLIPFGPAHSHPAFFSFYIS